MRDLPRYGSAPEDKQVAEYRRDVNQLFERIPEFELVEFDVRAGSFSVANPLQVQLNSVRTAAFVMGTTFAPDGQTAVTPGNIAWGATVGGILIYDISGMVLTVTYHVNLLVAGS